MAIAVKEDTMARVLVSDELWKLVQPLLPKHPPSPKGGKPRTDDRICLSGILFVLKTGIPWEDFPQEMGCCGMTLWNRLQEWTKAGVWDRLHRLLLGKLRDAQALDFDRVVVDSSSVRALHGGKKQAPTLSIGPNRAPNTTWSPTPAACRWPASSRRPMSRM
jgi:transposase